MAAPTSIISKSASDCRHQPPRPMPWQQLLIHVEDNDAALVEAAFTQGGAEAVTLLDRGEQRILESAPGSPLLWSQTRVIGLWPEAVDLEGLRQQLVEALGAELAGQMRHEPLQDRVWELEWRNDFSPQCFAGRLMVGPERYAKPGRTACHRASGSRTRFRHRHPCDDTVDARLAGAPRSHRRAGHRLWLRLRDTGDGGGPPGRAPGMGGRQR